MELKKLMEHISIIPDYRQAWKVEHKLSDILLLTICAVISGAEGWEDIEDFGETHLDFLKQYGDFENGIPVHDTIARVVSCISPSKFHECFINWMRDCHTSDDKDVIAIDGKTLRHSYDKSRRKGAIHVISAFSTMHSLVIGQIRTDEKSNEITAIPELLNMLDIKGKIITTDAMGCQKDIAEKIQKQGALSILPATPFSTPESVFVAPLASFAPPTQAIKAFSTFVIPSETVSGMAAYSSRNTPSWLINAGTTLSAVSLPSSAIALRSLRATPIPAASARTIRSPLSLTELNSSPRNTPCASAWLNWVITEPASAVLAPEIFSPVEMASVTFSTSSAL